MLFVVVTVLLWCLSLCGLILIAFEISLYNSPVSTKCCWLGFKILHQTDETSYPELLDTAKLNHRIEVAPVASDKFVFSLLPSEESSGNFVRGVVKRVSFGSSVAIYYPVGVPIFFCSVISLIFIGIVNSENDFDWLGLTIMTAIIFGLWGLVFLVSYSESKRAVACLREGTGTGQPDGSLRESGDRPTLK